MSETISQATEKDILQLIGLLNKAYRGESSQKGWTSEAHLIAGNTRTNVAELKALFDQPGGIFFKVVAPDGKMIGCMNLRKEVDSLYLGMLSVDPDLQGGGIGKKLLTEAEQYASSVGCNRIFMSVVSLRKELIDWYKRHGYKETGETIPFVEHIEKSGKHLQPLEFIVMEKWC